MPASVVGRDAELAALNEFVAGVPEGASVLVLEGEAGMGKTTLWRHAAEMAQSRSLTALRAQPAESETALSFSVLGDLLEAVLEPALEPLPEGQRAALARALVLDEAAGAAPDPHAVGVAVLNVLRGLASERPLVVCIDDVQWLDAASAAALTYALRRLDQESVGVLLARRAGLESALLDDVRRAPIGDRLTQVEVGPMSADGLHQVIHGRLGAGLPRPLLAEVHAASGGNPFYAIEIVRSLTAAGVSVEAGKPLPVPDSLHEAVHDRLLALPGESREFLTAAAAHAHPTVAVTEAASGVAADVGLTPALDAQIVLVDRGRIRFTHPLLAAGAYETADPLRRTQIHARLAEILTDPEARAWQLAACVETADEAVAAALEDAARGARDRGAPRPAALLLDRSCELTPADRVDDADRRAIDAAYLHFESGDSPRAEAQLQRVIAGLAPGRTRARALMRLGRVRAYVTLAEAADTFAQAVEEAEGDPVVLAVAHEGVATCLFRLHERLGESARHAELAAGFALDLGDDRLAAEALGTQWVVETLRGSDRAAELGERALALQPVTESGRVLAQPRFAWAAGPLRWIGALAHARSELVELLDRAVELGDESSRPLVLAQLAEIECVLGDLGSARLHAIEGQKAADQSGQRTVFAFTVALEGLAETRLGRVDRARSVTERALALALETGGRQAEHVATLARGELGLVLGDPAAAVDELESYVAFSRRQGLSEPGALPHAIDEVEALIELGRPEEAAELLDWYEGNARRLERTSAMANCARCRGLLAAQMGDLGAALAAFDEALALHAEVEVPLDRGRTLLALGAAQRRLKRRREARTTLESALAVFDGIGVALWAERARGELKRISGRAATPGALTPAEERVAALVAAGKTNKEVAAALFLSDRTVEGHLAHIFGKLGIRHRTEIAAALQTRGIAVSNTGDAPVSAEPASP